MLTGIKLVNSKINMSQLDLAGSVTQADTCKASN